MLRVASAFIRARCTAATVRAAQRSAPASRLRASRPLPLSRGVHTTAGVSHSALARCSVNTGARATTTVAPIRVSSSRQFGSMTASPTMAGVGSSSWLAAAAAIAGVSLAVLVSQQAEDLHADTFKDVSPLWAKIREELVALMDSNPNYDDGSYGPVFLRLAWHASGTYDKSKNKYGSNGATMRFDAEASHGANAGLKVARDLLEGIKKKHPEISYGDLWTFAGKVACEHMGMIEIPWKPGRVDATGPASDRPDGLLPAADKGADHARGDIFGRMGFTDAEVAALMGAHALGRCHTDRSGYTGPWTNSPTMMSNDYYVQLLNKKQWRVKKWKGPLQYEDPTGQLMMLPIEIAMADDPKYRAHFERYARDEDAWKADFARALGKLFENGVPRR